VWAQQVSVLHPCYIYQRPKLPAYPDVLLVLPLLLLLLLLLCCFWPLQRLTMVANNSFVGVAVDHTVAGATSPHSSTT
jgi:hypothetical protein